VKYFKNISLIILLIFSFTAKSQTNYQYNKSVISILNTNTPNTLWNSCFAVPDNGNGYFFTTSGDFSKTTVGGNQFDFKQNVYGFVSRTNQKGLINWAVPFYGSAVISAVASNTKYKY